MVSHNKFYELLSTHEKLSQRNSNSNNYISSIREKFSCDRLLSGSRDIELFVAGSIGRLESGAKSDFDVFIISSNKEKVSNLDTYKIMATIIDINNSLGFPEFSNDGMYLKVHYIDKMISATGSPNDDSENMFTTRMLLLLESRYVHNQELYNQHLNVIVSNYFRDATGRTKDFKPLFILNDLLRYWRTLCLNYEGIRNSPSKPWRKKNVNLKFSRMLTVFGTVVPLLKGDVDKEKFITLCSLTPLERLANSLADLGGDITTDRFSMFLDDYEMFLSLKENESVESKLTESQELKNTIDSAAERFSSFIYDCLMSDAINDRYKRFLVV